EKAVLASLSSLEWEPSEVQNTNYMLPTAEKTNDFYFIDFPGAKQSVLYIGKLAISGKNPDYNEVTYANQKLGGGSSGELFQTLRIEKGYTYGAYSYVPETAEVSPFIATSSVRANATLPSLEIMKSMIANYAENFSEEDVEVTRNQLLKGDTRAFESLGAKLNMLHEISKFKKPKNFMEEEQKELTNMTLADYKNIINKYMSDKNMVYLVVGDGESQLEEIKKLGLGDPILLDIYGNPVVL
ncbi:MAG: insulinase family protein, partial [Cyclobacteriaceae bacterium]